MRVRLLPATTSESSSREVEFASFGIRPMIQWPNVR